MASSPEFVQYVADQLSAAGIITYRKMFGEYALYCNGKIFALICDDQLLLKKTEAAARIAPYLELVPIPGYEEKKFFLIEDVDDKEFLTRIVVESCKELPMQKKRKPKKSVSKNRQEQKGDKTMLFIQYPPYSTCKKAKNWLDENGLEYDSRNIKEENPTYEELKEWYSRSGLPLKRFFNTSGMLYKSMGLKDKLESMSEDEQLSLLATDGMLVKRPLIIADNVILTGFRQKEWEEKLK